LKEIDLNYKMKRSSTYILDEFLRKRREENEKERKRILLKVKETLIKIRNKYGIEGAFVLGSLIKPYRWGKFSDVDIAVEGASKYILDIMKEIEDVTNCSVDVIDLDRHPLKDYIKRKGLKIYGRED